MIDNWLGRNQSPRCSSGRLSSSVCYWRREGTNFWWIWSVSVLILWGSAALPVRILGRWDENAAALDFDLVDV
jgi:hypothetical protein